MRKNDPLGRKRPSPAVHNRLMKQQVTVVEPKPGPPLASEVASALEKSVRLSEAICKGFDHQCELGSRADHCVRYFAMAIDHREAILLLVSAGARSSAYALLRSVYEACFRGLWTRYVASDAQLEQLRRGQLPSFESVVRALSKVPNPLSKRVFGGSKRLAWDAFCDYSHGGARQMRRFVSEDGIGPSHPDHELPGFLNLLDFLGAASHDGILDAASEGKAPPEALMQKLAYATVIIERSAAA
jgi:hypothetical protein